jgi:hypothetical protein
MQPCKIAVACMGTVLLAGSAAAAPSSGAATAVAAKKKKCKTLKCRRARYRRQATAFMQGHSYSRANPPTGVSQRLNLCTNGTSTFRAEINGSSGSWVDTFNGTWRVAFAGSARRFQMAWTTANFQSVYSDGSPGPDPPPPASLTVNVEADSATTVKLDNVAYSRDPGAC